MEVRIKNLFAEIEDPRIDRTKKHPLESILYIVLCGTIAGVDSWIGFQDYGEHHFEILKTFIDLPNGVPSHDTFARVIERLDVEVFARRFEAFVQEIAVKAKGIIAVDGKTMRGSHNEKKKVKARHIVSAWADHMGLVLAQEKVDEKSNEITAIPELLKRLDLGGQIVTLDAMGCQRDICDQIISQGGDYVISLKGNQGSLHEDVKEWFESEAEPYDQEWEEWDKGHGRIEHRKCMVYQDTGWLAERHNWPGLKSIAVVESERITSKETQRERRYYITSLEPCAEKIAHAARRHWGIENRLHWVLDVVMGEDNSRIRTDNAPEVLALMRKWGLNIINQHKGTVSVKRMIMKMAMSPKNLLLLLQKI